MTATTLVLAVAIITFAGFGQTVAGFGFSLMAVPLLGLVIDPKDAVAVAMIGLLANSAAVAWNERTAIDWEAVRVLLIGAAPGLPLGLVLIQAASETALRLGLAAAIALAIVALVRGPALSTAGRGFEWLAGFSTGVLTTSLNTNGPPTVIALQARALAPPAFRASSSAVLGLTSLAGAGLFAVAGRFTSEVATISAASIPALGVGWFIGARVRQGIPVRGFRRLVLALLALSALATVIAAIRS